MVNKDFCDMCEDEMNCKAIDRLGLKKGNRFRFDHNGKLYDMCDECYTPIQYFQQKQQQQFKKFINNYFDKRD